jgi:hypothetical protein
MLHITRKHPILDNPFRLIGLNGVALEGKTVEQAVALARAISRALKDSPSVSKEMKRLAVNCIDELSNPERAKAYLQAFKGMSPDAVVERLVELGNKVQEQATDALYAAWLYTLERGAPASLKNAVRISPATVEVTDIVSMLQSPIRETSPIARKLFKRTLTSVGDGRIENGAELPGGNETHRETIGVLHLKALNRSITFKDVEKVIRHLGLINASSHCIEHYDLSESTMRGGTAKVPYPKAQHPVFSHFHPIAALERLLVFHVDDIKGGIRAEFPKTDRSSCNILLSKVRIGSTAAVCLEGVVEAITDATGVQGAKAKRTSATPKRASAEKKSSKSVAGKKSPSKSARSVSDQKGKKRQ